MQLVQGDEVPVKQRVHQHRVGTFRYQRILAGEPGTPGNFVFEIVHTIDDFFSPRHRHNFDQFRFQLDGEFDFDRNGKMKPGVLGYFPEGAFYGPQSSDKSALTAVVQFGGPSGSGYMNDIQMEEGARELKKFGVFEKGVFRRKEGVEGKKNTDGYQAIWEHVNKRPMAYPKPQYYDPIMMNADSYQWAPIEGMPGVEEKALGTFTDCKIRCGRFKLDLDASFKATGRGIYLVLSGRGSVEGQPFRRLTTVLLETGESATFKADEAAEMVLLGLPDVARMKKEFPVSEALEAAE
jgi:hypothetical protein